MEIHKAVARAYIDCKDLREAVAKVKQSHPLTDEDIIIDMWSVIEAYDEIAPKI